jgi:PST family polysaccharide transporter
MLAHKTAYASFIMIATRISTRFGDLITLLVLAHELTPSDFGIVALAASLMFIAEQIFEIPLIEAVLRLDVLKRSHLDTAFTISLIRGLAVMIIVLALAWPFAYFYGDSRLVSLIALLSLAPGMRGMQSPKMIIYMRTLSYWRNSVVEFSGKAMALIVAVGLAMSTHSYWAIAAGTVANPVMMLFVSFCLAPYRPRLSLTEWRHFAGFFGWTTLTQVIKSINWQSDIMLLGRIAGRVELGLFTTANNLASAPLLAILGPMYNPLVASIASVKNDPERLRRAYLQTSNAAITVGLPILAGESLVAKPLIQVMLGSDWLAAANMVCYLALSFIPSLFALPFGPLVLARNQMHYFALRNASELCVKLPLLIIGGLKFGLLGIVAARVISEFAVAAYSAILVRRLIGLSIREQIAGPWRSFTSTLFMAAGVIVLNDQLQVAFPFLPPIVLLGSLASAGGAIYAVTLALLWIGCGRPPGIEHVIYQSAAKFVRLPAARVALR